MALLILPLWLSGGYAAAQDLNETGQLIQVLKQKRDALRTEQEYLLFQKAFYESDSKYLVLQLTAGKGWLMYRNRILRSFDLERTGNKVGEPSAGIATLTAKTDGASKSRALLFGDVLELHSRKNAGTGGRIVGYRLGKKDLAALYYALEAGTKAYIK